MSAKIINSSRHKKTTRKEYEKQKKNKKNSNIGYISSGRNKREDKNIKNKLKSNNSFFFNFLKVCILVFVVFVVGLVSKQINKKGDMQITRRGVFK